MPETTDRNLQEVDPHLTAKIVESYVRHHTVGTGQVSELITSVHGALAQLGRPSQPEEVLTPAVSIRQSVRQDYVVCLNRGYRAKTLRRHISTQHNLSRDEYFKRWGLRKDHPLTAPAYTEPRWLRHSALAASRRRRLSRQEHRQHSFRKKPLRSPTPNLREDEARVPRRNPRYLTTRRQRRIPPGEQNRDLGLPVINYRARSLPTRLLERRACHSDLMPKS